MQANLQRLSFVLRLLIALVAAVFLTIGAATAQDNDHSEALDALFAKLRVAPDYAAAKAIDSQIWILWMQPSDPVLAGRMDEALRAERSGNARAAIELLTAIIEDYPDYSEAWNQRATMYFVIGDYAASIADCGSVLELEPRHFGALAGRALIHLRLGNRAAALQDITIALKIHPFLNERQLFPELSENVTRI